MIVRRYVARVADVAQEQVDAYCDRNPDFAEIWRLMIWRLEFAADKIKVDRGDGWYTASLLHSPRFPLTTVYFKHPDRGSIVIVDVTFHVVN